MSLLRNINYMAELTMISCTEPDIWVIARTGLASAPPALLSLFLPGCTDIVKMKLGLSPWHARGIRSMIKGIAAPGSIGGNKFLYKVGYFTAERGLYYFMLADVTTTFLNTWQSMVFQAEQCQLPDAGTAYGYVAPFIYIPDSAGGLGITPIHNVPGMSNSLNGVNIHPGFEGNFAFECTWDSWPERGKPTNVNTWVVESEVDFPTNVMNNNAPGATLKNWSGGHGSFNTVGDVVSKTYALNYANIGDQSAQVVSGSYTVSLRGNDTGALPWGCKPKKTSIPFT